MAISSVRDSAGETFAIDLAESRRLLLCLSNAALAGGSPASTIREAIIDGFGDDCSALRAAAIASLVADLMDQGWSYSLSEVELKLHKPEVGHLVGKESFRIPLLRERDKKLKEPATVSFIKRMERPRKRGADRISVANLVADGDKLQETLRDHGADGVQPYVQVIGSPADRDCFTGYKLQDIWRYFRLTWALPYRPTPGRKVYILVRDEGQPWHPIIGIAALGNSIVHIPSRDRWIGWTVDAVAGSIKSPRDSKEWYQLLLESVNKAVDAIKQDDLVRIPSLNEDMRVVETALESIIAETSSDEDLVVQSDMDWEKLSGSLLYRKKRAKSLLRLIRARETLIHQSKAVEGAMFALLNTARGRNAISVALETLKNRAIGTNMMDIIVCGAVPPYNHLLGGKLVSLLMLSREIRVAYENRYRGRVSIIASGMRGSPVLRDPSLVLIGTTSLYHVGSSQYNRLQIPSETADDGAAGSKIGYLPVGTTEGYGSVYISDMTVRAMERWLEKDGRKQRVSTKFGAGTSPRMRLIRTGLQSLGVHADLVLKHDFKRIVYVVELARNARRFLLGQDDHPSYYFNHPESTKTLVEYWRKRWLEMRLSNSEVADRVQRFQVSSLLLGEYMKALSND